MKRDRIANEMVIPFVVPDTKTTGTYYSSAYDTWTSRSYPTNMLLITALGDGCTADTTTVTLHLQDSADNSTWAAHATVAQMTYTSSDYLFLAEIKDFRRYIKLKTIIGGASAEICVIGVLNRSKREPVYQWGTEKTVTYS